VIWLLNKGE